MAKAQINYTCQSCGAVHSKWSGRCDACEEWNSIVEEVQAVVPKGMAANSRSGLKGRQIPIVPLDGSKDKTATKTYERLNTGIKEFDRVTGGGLVPGSAILIGGDPGIGKSTLLLQTVCSLAQKGVRCMYISGEEAVDQVRMRAKRLGLEKAPVELAAATNVRDILATISDRGRASVTANENNADNNGGAEKPVSLLIIDSIQTMFVDNIESAPGTVTQVRTSAHEIIRRAKDSNMVVIFVGHVTKDGQIAGPRVLEHMVDTVLYFEGDRSHHFRILRGVKNRFGPTDEIGVFEMAGHGLVEVENPSALFLAQRHENVSGSAVLAALEGTRPMLVEVQALVAPSSLASPRRAVLGYESNRLAMIGAVLETRCGLSFSGHDIFLNIAGGIRIAEPAADLAVAAALISALSGEPLPEEAVFFGEIGLAGEVRGVPQSDLRLKEAAKLGFKQAVLPSPRGGKSIKPPVGLKLKTVSHITDIRDMIAI